ncbi:uncharacterized protein C8orf34 homolog [Rhinatrema bivittatum]|uniref:uncharacterized protein C8orf34 homolog n=1 Tax=Rhinatrema bivittatum TaxID=194408 RepID=UPI001127020D|nr:uncharacterized protein C8orf34 homolog [Rhinatrema bivittatum]
MAAHRQTRIQAYLEKNKIGSLFEELMTKLITDTPDQPIPFLISHLQSKQGNFGQLQRTLSGSAALWAESNSPENKRREFRNYDKPWLANAKKPKKSKSDLAVSNLSPPSPESKTLPRSLEHPNWDWRTKPESHDFDELNHILQESKKLGKALENLSRSIAISDELEQDSIAFNSSLLRPCVIGEWVGREENDADPLADEMLQPPVPRNKNEQWESEEGSSSPAGSLKMEPKSKGLKQQQQHHKKLLAAMLSQDSFDSVNSTAPSLTEDDIHDEDDAMELLEDFDDLRMEGVTSLIPSGSKYSQGRSTYTVEPQAKVTLNICSRCARLQGDNIVEGEEDVPREHMTSASRRSDAASPSLPKAETLMEDDEEFESASQVTGPRHPVWDSDVISARSGGSPIQKLSKEALTAKELQSMEKHLADIEKDLALMVEARMSRSPSSQRSSLLISDQQGDLQASPGQNSRPQVPSQTGINSPLPLQGNNISLQTNSKAQVSSISNSRPQTPNTLINKFQIPSAQGSRPATPNNMPSRSVTPSSHGNMNTKTGVQWSRSITSKSQTGRTTNISPLMASQMDAANMGNTSQGSSLQEDEAFQQLQVERQPWILPSDTESEGVEAEQKKSLMENHMKAANKKK